jgi:mono/diheme cytochrome c family protein
MRRRELARTALLALPLALLLGAAGCRSGEKLTPQQAEGQHLYAVRCAHCHEDNDLGLKPPPPNIHGAMQRKKLPSGAATTDAELKKLVLDGRGKMPAFSGRFTDEQMAALTAYLRTNMPMPDGD